MFSMKRLQKPYMSFQVILDEATDCRRKFRSLLLLRHRLSGTAASDVPIVYLTDE
jgi:hypothetical protein